MTEKPVRVSCFIDGFNLYHAVHNVRRPHLKWLDLRRLMENFVDPQRHEITQVFYFSAYATWLPDANARHRAYVSALAVNGVTPVLGHFKNKDRRCPKCGHRWIGHEEKETDVNLAIWLLNEATRGRYDEAFLVTQDSDLAPAIQTVRRQHRHVKIKLIAPPKLRHSKQLARAAGTHLAAIKEVHLERSLLPAQVLHPTTGKLVSMRPVEYDPPSPI